jgi:hypothetical protein
LCGELARDRIVMERSMVEVKRMKIESHVLVKLQAFRQQ